jgi:arylsulfatase A-like enzyme
MRHAVEVAEAAPMTEACNTGPTSMKLIAAIALALALSQTAPGARPPNVILILADDMGVGDIAAFNGGVTRTPALDRLIAEGLWFERGYSASPVCSPARAALLTGRYPHRTGVVSLNLETEPELTRLKRDEQTLADVFGANGYATGLVGKWHTGLGGGFGPMARGFQEVACFHGSDGGGYFSYALHSDDNLEAKPAPRETYLTDELNQRAIDFVRRHAGRPFFLHLAHYAPHRPLEAPEASIAPYEEAGLDRETATVYAMIEIMDRGLGELFGALEELDLSRDTIILFASDNGPDILVPERFNNGLRGGKYMVHEGGIRVPFILRWPGVAGPGVCAEAVHFTDVLPTLVELCGLKHEPPLPIDGSSFAALVTGKGSFAARARFWQWNRHQPNYTHNAAMLDGRWKLVKPYVTKNKISGDSDSPHQLFHLTDDPGETRNLAPLHQKRVEAMRAALDEWSRAVESDRKRTP